MAAIPKISFFVVAVVAVLLFFSPGLGNDIRISP